MTYASEDHLDWFLVHHAGRVVSMPYPGVGEEWDATPGGLRDAPWSTLMATAGWALLTHAGIVVGNPADGYTMIRSHTRAALARVRAKPVKP